jgi:YesN/AraC family two-component response regulator
MDEKTLKVLVVEDDYFVKTGIIRAVESLGHKVVGDAANGKIGLEKTLELHPDVILMDVEMKEMNGLEAATLIQDKCPTPIIFLSAYGDQDLVELASNTGASAYLTKPPHSADIARAITIAMARHQDLMQLRTLNKKLKRMSLELDLALAEVKTLRDFLPICCYCKKVRDDEGYWSQIEAYVEKHTDSKFTHGICPECTEEHYKITPQK